MRARIVVEKNQGPPDTSGSGFQQFFAERVELLIVIIVSAFMLSIVDETFRIVTYAIVVVGLALFGYNFYMGMKNPSAPEEEEILMDNQK